MAKRNRECYLCGEKYTYCPTCTQDKMKPSWMAEFHSENCKNIFDICTRFNMGLMSKSEAQDALLECDLTNLKNFKSYVQRDIENILKDDEAPKKRGKRAEMPIVEKAISEAEKPTVHEVVTIEDK